MPEERQVLLVANRTAVSSTLLEAVRSRAAQGPCRFHLLMPATPRGLHRFVDPEVTGRSEAGVQLDDALPRLSEAAGSEVTGEVGDPEPLAAIGDALHEGNFDEIILSTLPRRLSAWLRLDLPRKAAHFGVPITHVEADTAAVVGTEA